MMDVRNGVVYGAIELQMPKFFEDRHYGTGLQFIGYRTICVNDDFKQTLPPAKYISRSKKVECYIELDYKTVNSIHYKKDFMLYVKNVFLNEAQSFEELNIPDFKLDEFLKDLEIFFNNYNSKFDEKEEIEDFY
ncbi:MAG: hypothetical protein ACTHME_08490 [Candidatus Nitrosocosmicus sp.]